MALWADVRRQVGLLAAGLFDSVDDARAVRQLRARHLLQPDAQATTAAIKLAVDSGAEFLSRSQQRDGSLRDFLLPPGTSDTWITAHALFVLEEVPHLHDLRRRAVDYLERVGRRDGLWGYNRRVAPDVDSTTQALLALHRDGRRLDPTWVGFVLAQQRPSGGFATYAATGSNRQPANGWQNEHPDVTLLVVELLRRLDLDVTRALAYLETCSDDALLPPYWWNTSAYSAWAATRAGFRSEVTERAAMKALTEPTTAMPAAAMLLSAAGAAEQNVAPTVTRILRQQLDDGSWSCDPCLRVTAPSVLTPSERAPGPVFAGSRRVISTAHAVAALAAASNRRAPGH